jgi:hypothetical protein
VETRRNLSVSLRAFLEERLPVTTMEVRLTKVAGVEGVNLLDGRFYSPRSGFMGRGEPQWYAMGSASVQEPPGGMMGLMTVEGMVTVTCGTGVKELKVEDILGKKGQEAIGDGVKITLRSGSQDVSGVRVSFEVEAGADREVNINAAGVRGGKFGFFLEDAKGTRYGRTTSSGMSIQDVGATRKMTVNMLFPGAAKEEGAWSLVYVYPEKVTKREYPFKIEGIELPGKE